MNTIVFGAEKAFLEEPPGTSSISLKARALKEVPHPHGVQPPYEVG